MDIVFVLLQIVLSTILKSLLALGHVFLPHAAHHNLQELKHVRAQLLQYEALSYCSMRPSARAHTAVAQSVGALVIEQLSLLRLNLCINLLHRLVMHFLRFFVCAARLRSALITGSRRLETVGRQL